MNKNIPLEVLYPIMFTFLGTLILPPVYIIFYPLFFAYNWFVPGHFLVSGQHVDVFFFGVIFNSVEAWFFYGSFFFLAGLVVGTFKYCNRVSRQKQWLASFIVIVVLAFALRIFLDTFYLGLYP